MCPAKILHIAEIISAEGGISGGRQERAIAPHPASSSAAPTFLTTWVINAILEMPNKALWRRLNSDNQGKIAANTKVTSCCDILGQLQLGEATTEDFF